MRRTEFWNRLNAELGPGYAPSWASDHVIAALGGRTPVEAFDAGFDTKDVWRAVHIELGLPASAR